MKHARASGPGLTGVLALWVAVSLALSLMQGPAELRLISEVGFWLVIPGFLVMRRWQIPMVLKVGLVPAFSVASLEAIATAQLWTGIWEPVGWQRVMMAVCLVMLIVQWWPDRAWRIALPAVRAIDRASIRRGELLWWLAWLALVIGWLATLPRLARASYDGAGLAGMNPPILVILVVAVSVIFGVAIRSGRHVQAIASVVLLWAIVRLGPALITDAPSYSWTYKHLGVVDMISSSGSLPAGGEIYYAWPSMFAGVAWLADSSGSAGFDVARWFTPTISLLTLAAVGALARALGLRDRQIAVAMFMVMGLSWTGQDYFSPQAVGLALGCATLAAAMWAKVDRRLMLVALFLFAVLVPTHQLTPFWVAATVACLAFLGRVPGLVAWPMLAWLAAYSALNWDFIDFYGGVSTTSVSESTGPATVTDDPHSARAAAQSLYRMVAVSLWLPAVVVGFAQVVRRRRPGLEAGIMTATPFVLLAMQDYGGEGVLRVYLYSTAGAAMVLAPVVVSLLTRPVAVSKVSARIGAAVATMALAVWAVAGTRAYFAPWFANRVTASQFEVTSELLDEVEGPAYFSAAYGLWPHRPTAAYLPRSWERWDFDRPFWQLLEDSLAEGADMPGALAVAEQRMDEESAPTYVMFADQSYAEASFDGGSLRAQLDELHGLIKDSASWDLVEENGDVEVFTYLPQNVG